MLYEKAPFSARHDSFGGLKVYGAVSTKSAINTNVTVQMLVLVPVQSFRKENQIQYDSD